MSATTTVEDAERGRSEQCEVGVDVFDLVAAATRRGAHDVDLAAASMQVEEKAWCSCEASEVSPVPRRHRR
jgi:hypothetical protein